jgi:phage antirepressor YoqD-like protein
MTSGESILIRELAKIACKDGLNTGEHRLYRALRQWKLLNANNEPYQQYINSGYFEIVETPYDTEYGVRLARTTKVLPKGQQYIINKLQEQAI